ncbi:hypothetical protein IP84_16945 [beta proteobacterium AAP99]|nr:hypothetical protein IP84_16945 [beta proteobacterium AAP99]
MLTIVLMLVLTEDPTARPFPIARYETLAECRKDAAQANKEHSIMRDPDIKPMKPRFACFMRVDDLT